MTDSPADTSSRPKARALTAFDALDKNPPRAPLTEETAPVTARPAAPAPTTETKSALIDVNLHDEMKLLSVRRRTSIRTLLEEAVNAYLEAQPDSERAKRSAGGKT